jgi:hypothetical protein
MAREKREEFKFFLSPDEREIVFGLQLDGGSGAPPHLSIF